MFLMFVLDSSSQCPSSNGLFRHPFDCRKFYECKNGRRRLLSCPPNSVFDNVRQICDVIRNVPDCYIRVLLSGEVATSSIGDIQDDVTGRDMRGYRYGNAF